MPIQAIHTAKKDATDRTGSRIIAKCASGRVVMPYEHGLNLEGNHKAAAIKLMNKLGWKGKLVMGCLPDGSYAHVFKEGN